MDLFLTAFSYVFLTNETLVADRAFLAGKRTRRAEKKGKCRETSNRTHANLQTVTNISKYLIRKTCEFLFYPRGMFKTYLFII